MVDKTLSRPQFLKRKQSPWFWSFWALLGIILLTGIFFFRIAAQPLAMTDHQSKVATSDATFDVSLNKKQVNALVAYYLSDSNTNGYTFRVEDNIMMYGSAKFLGENFKFGMMLRPEITKNGNIILTAQKLAIGNLPLPISAVMQYVKSSYDAPKFVQINPKKKQIFIDMTKLPVTQGISFRAKVIDMKSDNFIFEGGVAGGRK
ncbi:YpmS family protein [uncultured Leuconostoc sp.]|uniref:YpmS family protein n=1 Tax=uncultured Leuconostoc sp. TaxID=173262 RepID=UPI0025DCC7E2|nr:YpmS family protein [uncultured Leuconostoc sp.]